MPELYDWKWAVVLIQKADRMRDAGGLYATNVRFVSDDESLIEAAFIEINRAEQEKNGVNHLAKGGT
ncbi:MAG: hypothetical protein HY098_08415 [Nitrospinae bacterium]|nr:hypothetical protein [Nitrospinota bacterium]